MVKMRKKRVRRAMNWHEMQDKGRVLLEKHGLSDWRISIENLANPMYRFTDGQTLEGSLGIYDEKHKVIRIEYRGAARHFRQTLLHEIAHIKRGKGGHDWKWIRIAEEIGCTFRNLFPYAWQLMDEQMEGRNSLIATSSLLNINESGERC